MAWDSLEDHSLPGFAGADARALVEDSTATLDDFREAVATLEPAQRTARRVFGGRNPLTQGIERALRNTRALLSARETPGGA